MSNTTPTPSTKTTFGVPSLRKPTPRLAINLANGVVIAAAIANLALASFPQIPIDIKVAIAQYSGGAVLFAKGIAGMFGVQVTDPSSSSK